MKSYIVSVICYLECSVYILIFKIFLGYGINCTFFYKKYSFTTKRAILRIYVTKTKIMSFTNTKISMGYCVSKTDILIKNTKFIILYKSNFK